jgi:hypothetical protein
VFNLLYFGNSGPLFAATVIFVIQSANSFYYDKTVGKKVPFYGVCTLHIVHFNFPESFRSVSILVFAQGYWIFPSPLIPGCDDGALDCMLLKKCECQLLETWQKICSCQNPFKYIALRHHFSRSRSNIMLYSVVLTHLGGWCYLTRPYS